MLPPLVALIGASHQLCQYGGIIMHCLDLPVLLGFLLKGIEDDTVAWTMFLWFAVWCNTLKDMLCVIKRCCKHLFPCISSGMKEVCYL